jgi:hypothetical protein
MDNNNILDALIEEFDVFDGNETEEDIITYAIRQPKIGINRVSVKKSEIHDKGLFATKDIMAGDILTIYPADYVEHRGTISKRTSKRSKLPPKQALGDYVLKYNSKISFVGNPQATDDNGDYLGHYANAGAAFYKTVKEYKAKIDKYSNARFKKADFGPLIYLVAVKSISKGEEILVDYGLEYWIKPIYFEVSMTNGGTVKGYSFNNRINMHDKVIDKKSLTGHVSKMDEFVRNPSSYKHMFYSFSHQDKYYGIVEYGR